MTERTRDKLIQLQLKLPEGGLVDAAWMERNGYSSSLRSQYVIAGWLTSPAPRVYRRSRGSLTWLQVVSSLQDLLEYSLTVGGRTALEQQGYAHYLSAGVQEVHLYGPKRPPTWLGDLPLDVKFLWHNSLSLFPKEETTVKLGRSTVVDPTGLDMALPVYLSSKERALLELLDELP